jgi:hypothetical protein
LTFHDAAETVCGVDGIEAEDDVDTAAQCAAARRGSRPGASKLRVITVSGWPSERTATCGLFTVVTSTPLLHLFALQFIEQVV